MFFFRTEHEMKKLICPRARVESFTCLGSKCAAWIWNGEEHPKRKWVSAKEDHDDIASGNIIPKRPDDVSKTWELEAVREKGSKYDSFRWVQPQSEADAEREGYCAMMQRAE